MLFLKRVVRWIWPLVVLTSTIQAGWLASLNSHLFITGFLFRTIAMTEIKRLIHLLILPSNNFLVWMSKQIKNSWLCSFLMVVMGELSHSRSFCLFLEMFYIFIFVFSYLFMFFLFRFVCRTARWLGKNSCFWFFYLYSAEWWFNICYCYCFTRFYWFFN